MSVLMCCAPCSRPAQELLESSFDAVNESVDKLTHFCEYVFEIDTEDTDPVITGATLRGERIDLRQVDPWSVFASAWRREQRLGA